MVSIRITALVAIVISSVLTEWKQFSLALEMRCSMDICVSVPTHTLAHMCLLYAQIHAAQSLLNIKLYKMGSIWLCMSFPQLDKYHWPCTFSAGLNPSTNLLFIWIQESKIWNTAQGANLFSKVQQNKLYELLYIYKVQCKSENLKHSNDAHCTFNTSDFSLYYFVNSVSTFTPLHVVIYCAIFYSFSSFSYFYSCMWSYTVEVYCVQMSLKKTRSTFEI